MQNQPNAPEFLAKYNELMAELSIEVTDTISKDENYKRLSETKAMYEIRHKTIMDDIFNYRDYPEKIENLSKVKSIIDEEIKELDKKMKQIEENHLQTMKPKLLDKIYKMVSQ